MATDITMRAPCLQCGSSYGKRLDLNGQATIRCAICARWNYNAPKLETGEQQRRVRTRPSIKPSQRFRIINRATGMCELSGFIPTRKDGLDGVHEKSHILSGDDAHSADITIEEQNSDHNLACLCESCNSGMSSLSFHPILYLRLLRRRLELEPLVE